MLPVLQIPRRLGIRHWLAFGETMASDQIVSITREERAAEAKWQAGLGEYLLPGLVFLTSSFYLLAFCRYSALEPDEGIVLQGAERILRGQVPYRDFFSFYTPGSYYLVAGLFRAFGDSFFVARGSVALAGGCCAMMTYLLTRRCCSCGISLFAAALTAFAGVSYRFLVLHNWYSTALCCMALYSAIRVLETGMLIWSFATGFIVSLAILFEQSKGAGLLIGLALGLTILVWKKNLRRSKKEYVASVIGFSLPFLLTFAYFSHAHAAADMVRAWLWPLQHYATANHVPFGYQNWSSQNRHELFHTGPLLIRVVKFIGVSPGFIVPALPIVAILVLAYLILRTQGFQEELPFERFYTFVLVGGTCIGLLFSVVVSRADVIHFMYLTPVWYVVLAWILGIRPRPKILSNAQKLFFAYICFAFFLMGFAMLLHVRGAAIRIETRRGWITTAAEDTVLPFIQRYTRAGDEVLVYPYLPLYNYLTATGSPVPLDYFQPGMNTPEQAEQILAALRSQGAQGVIFEPDFAEKAGTAWPKTPRSVVGSDPVARYLRENYRVCESLHSPMGWKLEFRVPSGRNCP